MASGAPGEIVYNSNTTADVLEAFVRMGEYNNHIDDLVQWYISNQEDDGSWFLGANKKLVRDIVTWSTSEALFALGITAQTLGEETTTNLLSRYRRLRRLTVTLLIIALLEAVLISGLQHWIPKFWAKLPTQLQFLLTWGVIVGLTINIASALFWDRLPWRKH
jgi:hypothetical protein